MRKEILQELQPYDARLVAVSKTKPTEQILKMYEGGQRIFGENRVQEMVEKHAKLPDDIAWHLIGHLQRNKVKYIAEFVNMIHSVDSIELAKEINKQAAKYDRLIPILLQVRIAQEDTKFGIKIDDLDEFVSELLHSSLANISISGVMGMATFTENEDQIGAEFCALKHCFTTLKEKYFAGGQDFKEISMGMSSDYRIALREGSTLVRIGSLIFGARS